MDGGATPGVRVAARDGGDLSVSAEGVRIGERLFSLGRIQDARQVSPAPETIALRVAGTPLVEFRPARPGDGRLALEAIYRLRPDLRPVGFETPETLPAGFPPLPARFAPPMLYPPQYGGYAPMPPAGAVYPPPNSPTAPPSGYFGAARPGYPPPQGRYMPSPASISANRLTSEVTPYPRSFFEVLRAVFALFRTHLATWLTLGLFVGVIPGAIGGAARLVVADTWQGWADGVASANSSLCTFPAYTAPPTEQLVRDAGLFAGLLVCAALFSAFATATLTHAAHEALLGRSPRFGASLASGLRRFPAVLGATAVLLALLCVLIIPGFICFLISLPSLSGLNLCVENVALSGQAMTGLSLYVLGAGLLLGGGVTYIILSIRFVGAPYLAAMQPISTGAALAKSWRLTRGFFWKTLGLFALMWLMMYVVGALLSIVSISVADLVESLVVLPLAQVIAAPLFALLLTTHFLDLRLRREGYAAVRGESGAQRDVSEGFAPPPT